MACKICHVCDRCKKEYQEDEYRCSIVRVEKRPGIKIHPGFTAREIKDQYGISVSFELCTECRKELYAFLRRGEEA